MGSFEAATVLGLLPLLSLWTGYNLASYLPPWKLSSESKYNIIYIPWPRIPIFKTLSKSFRQKSLLPFLAMLLDRRLWLLEDRACSVSSCACYCFFDGYQLSTGQRCCCLVILFLPEVFICGGKNRDWGPPFWGQLRLIKSLCDYATRWRKLRRNQAVMHGDPAVIVTPVATAVAVPSVVKSKTAILHQTAIDFPLNEELELAQNTSQFHFF